MFLDARYQKVHQKCDFVDCAVLVALGIGSDGKRTILGVSEAEVHWRQFFTSLQACGPTAPQGNRRHSWNPSVEVTELLKFS
jgi:transposase-like protein